MALPWSRLILVGLTATAGAQRTVTWGDEHRTVRYEFRLVNLGDEPAPEVEIHVPLPQGDARQDVHHLRLSPAGLERLFADRHGQRFAHYRFASLPPGEALEVGFVAGVGLRSLRWQEPGRPGGPGSPTLSPEERALYLAPAANYAMASPALREAAGTLAQGAASELEKVSRIHDFIVERVRYARDGRWDPADQVLARGSGSCSEFNYLLSGLCRLAGVPTRAVGGTTMASRRLPATDAVFHRWTEVFLDRVGWFPVDCSRDSNPLRGKRSHFGRVYADALVWSVQAGGEEDILGWEYRARHRAAGKGSRLLADHRARWHAWQPEAAVAAAGRWLLEGGAAAPAPDALECALVHWPEADRSSRLRAIRALAAAGRSEGLRRAATLPGEERGTLVRELCADPALADEILDLARRPERLRSWLRAEEGRLEAAGEGRFRLPPREARPAAAALPAAWPDLAAALVGELDAHLPTREASRISLLLAPLADAGAGLAPAAAAALQAALERAFAQSPWQLLDSRPFAAFLAEKGPGAGEYWPLFFGEPPPPERRLPEALRPAVLLVPVAAVVEGDGRRLRLEIRGLEPATAETFRIAREAPAPPAR